MKQVETGVFQLPDGRFRLRATITDPITKKRKDKQITLARSVTTLAEALTARKQLIEEMQPPKFYEIHEEAIRTVGDYAVLWLERKAPSLKPLTVRNYARRIEDFILPVFDDLPIDRLSRSHVIDWVAWADHLTQSDGSTYSRQTRSGWWSVLKMILLDLKAECGLVHDPTERVQGPRKGGGKKRERRTLSVEQLQYFLAEAERCLPTRFAEIYTMATTGMRVGEIHGLMWSDLDYDAGIIHIRRSASKGILTDTTKTGFHREAPMCDRLGQILREHRKKSLSHDGVAAYLVFPSTNGKPRFSGGLRKQMQALSESMGLPIKVGPQVLRRTYNTLSLEAGVSESLLRATMGHNSAQMTELYAGFSIEQKRAAQRAALPGVL